MKSVVQIDYQRELNEEQREVVLAADGPKLVLAGAGSGKTRTITYRVARLVEQGVTPSSILLVTFTNKAAREMLHRVECLLGTSLEMAWGGTFHHIGNLILRREAKKIGYQNNYTILDREDQKDLLDSCLGELGIDTKVRRFPKSKLIANIISLSRNTLVSLEDILQKQYPQFLEWSSQLNHLFLLYQERKQELNLMDYDDLLYYLWSLLRENEKTRRKYGDMFCHVLVDEYQDTNLIQAEIVDLLAQDHGNILAVGDDSQSIYSFRGANFANILDFPKKYPNCDIYKLETNYRSTAEILNLANRIIVHNSQQFDKNLRSVRGKGVKPVVVPTRDAFEQANFVASKIFDLREEGYDLEQIAILYRAHYQSMEIQMELTRRGIPFEVRSGLRFFEQAHIKDVIAYLKIVANPQDEIAWMRILKMYPGVGKKTAQRIWETVGESSDPLATFLADSSVDSLSRAAREGVESLRKALLHLEQFAADPESIVAEVVKGDYGDYLKTRYPDWSERLQDIEELSHFASQFTSLEKFLSELALLGELEAENIVSGGIADEKVTLSTVHQAKGLEWDCVFVVWLCEGGFPSARSLSQPENVEEERRLFYVACTRARDRLFLSYPTMAQPKHGQSLVHKPSRFLREIPPSFYLKEVFFPKKRW
ncbi:MAG: ATP-dependent helicase UvrD/PcrA [Candidatus Atribacteria bacterium]|nr:ATP-dependent helicase UvrD/PcrA [Candidatus Atribacteria bacterium]